MSGHVMVVEEVAQTVFGVNVPKHTNCYIEVKSTKSFLSITKTKKYERLTKIKN